MSEIWKDIEGYEGLYQVSSLGRIKSLSRKQSIKERILKLQVGSSGYCHVALVKEKKVTKDIHRLVAISFIPNPENKATVNHKWGNKFDNRACALEWATYSENHKHAFRIGLKSISHLEKSVIQYSLDLLYINKYKCQTEASEKTGISNVSISHVCNGRHKTAGGFIWKFDNGK